MDESRQTLGLCLMIAIAIGSVSPAQSETVGRPLPTSFSVCEEAEDGNGADRPECQAGDLRFQADSGATPSNFGFSIASGHLNGDAFEDLVVGDPLRNRVYVFFGRLSTSASYGLPADQLLREISAETQADLILEPAPTQAEYFGFSVAIGGEGIDDACALGDAAFPLAIGAPGVPGTVGDAAGRVFYLPSGSLCQAPVDPPAATSVNPLSIGSAFGAPVVEEDDEFGYSVAFGRLLTETGSEEDVIVGARNANGGAGRASVFPVTNGVVDSAIDSVVRIEGLPGDGLGEVLAVGDLDDDFDEETMPSGSVDDLAIGAVGSDSGKVLVVQGPLSSGGGLLGDGVYHEESSLLITPILGEEDGDFFGFSAAISDTGRLAVGAIFADNKAPGEGGDPQTNINAPTRLNAGKVYVWNTDTVFPSPGTSELPAGSAALVLVARRSGDQLGFAVDWADLDSSELDDLIVTARREDGSGLAINSIDQGTAYVVFDDTTLSSPVDLNQCVASSDCTGVAGVDVMIFGGDRSPNGGDELGYSCAAGDFNGDGAADLFLSSGVHHRVYAVTLEDTDDDRDVAGRNLRDDDDDNDGDLDTVDCDPIDPEIVVGADEIACNGIDENCNGMEDDRPDVDGDGFDACGSAETEADCDDDDPLSFPGAPEVCDGNDNDCNGALPSDERDLDEDGYVACSDWDDAQGDDPDLGGGDCRPTEPGTFPGAAPNETDAMACMRDNDDDDFGDLDPPVGVTAGTDCDDTSAGTFPGAAEIENASSCRRDEDEDGYGDVSPPLGVTAGSDCDDNDVASFPGAPEVCDGNDNDCEGTVPLDEIDDDGDMWVACTEWNDTQSDNATIAGGGDCAPMDADSFPGSAPNESAPDACMRDADGDNFGDLLAELPVIAGTDCDDGSVTTFPGAAPLDNPLVCMKDDDGDDYGDSTASLPVVDGSDCNDDDPGVSTGTTEVPDDGIDQDCNGVDTVTCFVDGDEDGFGGPVTTLADDGSCDPEQQESTTDDDCDDTDDSIYPGQTEITGDGIDQDCNGGDTIECFFDNDMDGSGETSGMPVLADDGSCDAEDQESETDDDCDDNDPDSYPGAPELCDGNDNGCTGALSDTETDGDGDLYVECSGWEDTQGDDGLILGGDDCDDTRSTTFSGAAENESVPGACRKDADDDGFGDLNPPAGVTAGTDCLDEGPFAELTYPGAAEIEAPSNCMRDVDNDGFGDANVSLPVIDGTDCDDSDPTSFPGAAELCDGNDNACVGVTAADEIDSDGDGYVSCSRWTDSQADDPGVVGGDDCDDTSITTFPGAAANDFFPSACMKDDDGDDYGDLLVSAPVVAGTDCDDTSITTFPGAAPIDAPDNCMKDDDGDDYGDSTVVLPVVAGNDCNDGDFGVNPGVDEAPMGGPLCSDGLDNDCDGFTDDDDPVCAGTATACPDSDSDGFADCTSDPTCDATGLTCGDCDDGEANVNPDETEVCDNLDNDCNLQIDEGFDADDDGFTTCSLPVPDCNDAAPLINPGAVEVCNDATDNDCDAATPDLFDMDGDGATCEVDCDDDDPAQNLDDADTDGVTTCDGDCNDGDFDVNPGVAEVCNDAIDNDCNPGTADIFDLDVDGATCDVDCDDDDPTQNLDDGDSDGFSSCTGDCDDTDFDIKPTQPESCDGIDNNCDGAIDELFDLDGDMFSPCSLPVGDCDETNAMVNPGAVEVCNDAVNNDCNPATPDVFDSDADGSSCAVDCDDSDDTSFPGAPESCDGNDNNCDTVVPGDELDGDGDGYVTCSGWNDVQGDDATIDGGDDCDDGDGDTFPGAAPNESVPMACMRDADGDNYGDLLARFPIVSGTDCDDGDANTFLGAAPLDNANTCMKDSDGDDYGDSAVILPVVEGTDCNDTNSDVNPGVLEGPFSDAVCSDMLDNDCDMLPDAADPGCAPPAPTTKTSGTDRGAMGSERSRSYE